MIRKNQNLVKEEDRMTSLVSRREGRFEARLSFNAFDWFLADRIVSLEENIEKVDSKRVVQLLMNVYLQQKTLLHMIPLGFN